MSAQTHSPPQPTTLNDLFTDIPSRMTMAAFLAYTLQSERQYQLLNGRPMVNPAPTTEHQRISLRLTLILEPFIRTHALGELLYAPCDVILGDYDVVQPDLLFVSADRAHIVGATNIQGAPDLVIEILSPSTADVDLGYKRHLYAQNGIREYWLVDPKAEQIEILTWTQGDYQRAGLCGKGETLTSPLLPSLAIFIEDILGD
jgi:Uma2 family endonuclease